MNFGLVDTCNEYRSVDLTNVDISCSITLATSKVETTFTYINQHDETLDLKYVFPLGDVAVYSFEARVDDRVIVAECRPRAEAKTTFHEAVESGHTAFLAEEDERSEDVFQMNIGNVPPNGTVQIILKYVGYLCVENLESDGSQLSQATFSLPSVINPRYTPSSSAIIPEFDPFEEPVVSNSASYTLSFEASLSMPFDIVEVSSRIDKYSTTFKTDHKQAQVKLVSEFKPDHNLQMIISMNKPLRSFAVCEPGDSSKPTGSFLSLGCLMAQFVPDFSQLTIQQESRTELVFVIDRSGSMEGSSIECASESLLLFLKALPIGCRFQIIGFGSTHSALFPEPVDYNETTLARAVEYQKSMQADMGGTEVLPALQAAFDAPLTGHGWYRQIIFVTDGDVTNANEVIGLVGANVTKARVFTVGIQTGSSSHLIGTVARVGRGVAAFIEENSQLRRVVMKILRTALQPRASEIKVHWNLTNELNKNTPVNVITVPSEIPPVFHNQVITVYGLISDGSLAGLKGSVSLECEILNQKQAFSSNIPSTEGNSLYSSSADAPLHRLAGKYQLNELGDKYKTSLMNKTPEDDPEIKTLREQIEMISCAINVISPVTAMIGVDPVKRERVLSHSPQLYRALGGDIGPSCYETCDSVDCNEMESAAVESGSSPFSRTAFCSRSSVEPTSYADECSVNENESAFRPFSAQTQSFPVHSEIDSPVLPESKPLDKCLMLADLQQIVGSWELNEELAKSLEIRLETLKSTLPKSWPSHASASVTNTVWATAVIIAYFELRLVEQKDEWELLIDKARRWLLDQALAFDKDVTVAKRLCDNLLELAKQMLENQKI